MPARIPLHPLTSLRFVAAAAIVIHHSMGLEFFRNVPIPPQALQIWVSFFYVLSGFILTYVHPSLEGPGAWRRFYVARFARIWPLHVATFALFLAVLWPASAGLLAGPINQLRAALNLALLQSWVPVPTWFFSFNAVSWSISVEAFFYAMFPLLLLDFRRTWAWKLAGAAGLVGLIMAIGTLMGLPATPAVPGSADLPSGLMLAFPPARLLEFLLGMVACAIVRPRVEALVLARPLTAELAVLALLAATAALFPAVEHALGSLSPFAATYFSQAGAMFVFAAMIIVFSFQAGACSRVLSARILVYLGEISFGIYLIHQILLRWLHPRLPELTAHLSPWLVYAGFWAVLLALAALGYHLIERPCRRAIMALSRRGNRSAT